MPLGLWSQLSYTRLCSVSLCNAIVLAGKEMVLSSAEAFLCSREAGEKEKESARGTMGRGKREDGFLLRRREGSSKERLRGPFLLGQFTSVKTSSAKRFKSLKFFAFSCKNDKPSHLF